MHALVVGCGRIGAGLARLLGRRGYAVTVIDRNPKAFERLGPAFDGRQIHGLGLDREVLLAAGIERADSLAAVTASDETNVVVARLAREIFRVPQVVARLYDPGKAEIYRRLGIRTISTTVWGIQRIADIICSGQLDVVASLGSGEVELVEAAVVPLLVGRSIAELSVPGEISVAAIGRAGHMLLPTSGTIFQQGDVLYLIVAVHSLPRLEALLAAH